MSKIPGYAVGKGKVKQIECPVCESMNCEEVTRRDKDLPKGTKRVTLLCYDCGAYRCSPPII